MKQVKDTSELFQRCEVFITRAVLHTSALQVHNFLICYNPEILHKL
jgi:hypothetical protein